MNAAARGRADQRSLLAVRLLAAAGTAAMTGAIVAAFATVPITEDGQVILALPWGRVSLIDLYLAVALGWVWIAWRERSVTRAALWGVAAIGTGSLAVFVYLLGASLRAGSTTELVLGPHRREAGS